MPALNHAWVARQGRQRAMLELLARLGWSDLPARRVLDIGCRTGDNLLELLLMGFSARNLAGIEPDPARFAHAMQSLPSGVVLMQADPLNARLPDDSEDIVLQSEVFSGLLDAPFQQRMASTIWRWVRPGGGVLWYDRAGDGPTALPVQRIRELFPEGRLDCRRLTLAEPIARLACRMNPVFAEVLGALPIGRTHVLAWIEKPRR